MAQPKTIEGRQHTSFVESPTRPNNSAREVVIGNPDAISFEDNIEQDFADGNISAIKAVYKTVDGVALGEFNTTINESTIIGITRTSAADGDKLKYKTLGKLEDSSLNFPINDPLYLGANGLITNVAPTEGFRVRLGTSNGSNSMQILIEEPIEL